MVNEDRHTRDDPTDAPQPGRKTRLTPVAAGGPPPAKTRLAAGAAEASRPSGTAGQDAGTAPKTRLSAPAAQDTGPAPRTRLGQAPASPGAPAPRTRMAGTSGTSAAGTSPRPRLGTPPDATPADTAPGARRTTETTRDSRRPVRRRVLTALAVVAGAVALVLLARWLRTVPAVQDFIATWSGYPPVPEATPTGLPGWIGWQHFFNMFLMVLIVRTGLQVRLEKRPAAYWTPRTASFFSPRGATPKKVTVAQWTHQFLDIAWVLNGIVFAVLLFGTGHWMRLVPTTTDLVPHAASALLQYVSLDWPTAGDWVHYNALQQSAYFVTVFVMAPLAVISGVRLSTWWPDQRARLSKIYPIGLARAVHFPVMIYFVAFTVAHVFLVFFTGALRNLNLMYAGREATDWWGLAIFAGSLLVIVGGWLLAKPMFVVPAASRFGKVSR